MDCVIQHEVIIIIVTVSRKKDYGTSQAVTCYKKC